MSNLLNFDIKNLKAKTISTSNNSARYSLSDTIFLLTIGTLLVFSVVAGILSTTQIASGWFLILFRTVLILGILRLIFLNKITLLFMLAVIVVSLAIIGIDILTFEANGLGTQPFIYDIFDFVDRTISYVLGLGMWSAAYDTAIAWALNVGVALFVFIFGFLWFNFFALFGFSMLLFGLILNSGFYFSSFAFYAFIFCIIAYFIKHLNFSNFNNNSKSFTMLYAIPFTAICLIIALALPKPSEGFSEQFAQSIIAQPFTAINNALQDALRPSHFSLAQTGFGTGNTRLLGGDVTTNYSTVMRIQTNQNLYLTGAILDYYTGYSWINTLANYYSPLNFSDVSQNIELFERQSSFFTMWANNGYFDIHHNMDELILQEHQNAERFLSLIEGYIRTNGENIAYDTNLITMNFSSDIQHFGNIPRFLLNEPRYYLGNGILWINQYYEEPSHFFAWTEERFEYFVNINAIKSHILTQNLPVQLLASDIRNEARYEHFFQNNLSTKDLLIDTYNFSMFTVFTSGIVEGVQPHNDSTHFIIDKGGNIASSAIIPRGNRYIINHTELENVSFEGLLSSSYTGILSSVYERYRMAVNTEGFDSSHIVFNQNGISISYASLLRDYLIPRASWINEVYTTLPEHFPQRVRDYAYAITQGAQNNLQKALMLEMYLRQNFEYTLTPGNLPAGRDFVDHFLFDIRRGYCTYYASAFVTMARSLGIPARYVEGFIVTGLPDDMGYVNVLNRHGHAWAEVYFEGFGWFRFEPTPPEELHAAALPSFMPYTNISFMQYELNGEFASAMYPLYETVIDGAIEDAYIVIPATIEETNIAMSVAEVLLMSVIIVLTLSLVSIIIRVSLVIYKNYKDKQKNNKEFVICYFYKILRYMSVLNYNIGKNETAMQFANRVSKRISFSALPYVAFLEQPKPSELYMGDIAAVFSKASYSAKEINDTERKMLANAIVNLEDKIIGYIGKKRYILYKYILARF